MTNDVMLESGSGNIYHLDENICRTIKKFYQALFETLKTLDLLGKKLQKKAHSIFSHSFFRTHLYTQGFHKIKHHLRNKNTVVVLLSGSVQELLDPLFEKLCEQLDEENLAWKKRFFIQGTILEDNKVQPCVGSGKNRFLKTLLRREGYDHYTLQFIYSDNSFMADLPLLIEAKHGGALISKKNNLYQQLPKKLLASFTFLPEWNRSPLQP